MDKSDIGVEETSLAHMERFASPCQLAFTSEASTNIPFAELPQRTIYEALMLLLEPEQALHEW
jgi:hypothetical protein